MQSLCSRASQAPRYVCGSCSTAVRDLGRRVSVAPRRKVTFAEVFTACYSSVLASAVLIDSIRKEERRQDMDRQIDEARTDLALLKARGLPTSDAKSALERQLEPLSDNQMDGLWLSLKSIVSTRPYITDARDLAQLNPGDFTKKLRRDRYFKRRRRHWGVSKETKLELLEQAILLEEVDESIPRREAITLVHLEIQTNCIRSLIQRLMHTAQRLAQLRSGWQDGSAFRETSKLLKRKWSNFTLRGLDPATAQQQTCKLNKSIRSVLYSEHLSLEEKIGRVCYNLLTTTFLPDMHTYNTMIVGFDKIGLHSCSEHTIKSFFFDRTLKPTRCTHAAVLHHYKTTNNTFQFYRVLECLCGVNPTTGALVRRKYLRDIVRSKSLMMWSLDTRHCTHVRNRVYEHAPLCRILVDEIIQGLLHFKLFNEAVYIFIMCLQRMVYLTTNTFRQVLDSCLDALDWDASVHLLRGLSRHKARRLIRLLNYRDKRIVAYFVDRLYSLLELSGINSVDDITLSEEGLANMDISKADMEEVLRILAQTASELPAAVTGNGQYQKSGGDSTKTGSSWSRILQLESLSKEVIKVRMATKNLECGLLRVSIGTRAQRWLASHIASAAIGESLALQDEYLRIDLASALSTEDIANQGASDQAEQVVTRHQCKELALVSYSGKDNEQYEIGSR